jgi:uncharacterized protein (DUF427 family)
LPFKGDASYWSMRTGDRIAENAAWIYSEPLEDAVKVRDHLCFLGEGLTVEVDGKQVE